MGNKLDKQSFSGFNYTDKSTTQYGISQLWNPVGSGKVLLVDRVTMDCHDASFGVEILTATTVFSGAAKHPKNKYLGSTDSIAEMRTSITTTYPGGDVWAVPQVVPYVFMIHDFKRPVIVPPGCGLLAAPEVFNVQLCINWEFRQYDA